MFKSISFLNKFAGVPLLKLMITMIKFVDKHVYFSDICSREGEGRGEATRMCDVRARKSLNIRRVSELWCSVELRGVLGLSEHLQTPEILEIWLVWGVDVVQKS